MTRRNHSAYNSTEETIQEKWKFFNIMFSFLCLGMFISGVIVTAIVKDNFDRNYIENMIESTEKRILNVTFPEIDCPRLECPDRECLCECKPFSDIQISYAEYNKTLEYE